MKVCEHLMFYSCRSLLEIWFERWSNSEKKNIINHIKNDDDYYRSHCAKTTENDNNVPFTYE